jgi:hypothetical protein
VPVQVEISQTLAGVTVEQFSDPTVQDTFKNAVADSAGVTSDKVEITGYNDTSSAAESDVAVVSLDAMDTIVARRLSSALSVQYQIVYTVTSASTSVLTESNALISKINSAITSGNFTKNLASAATTTGITINWSASTVPTYNIVTPSPSAIPTRTPTGAPVVTTSSETSSGGSSSLVIIGVAIGGALFVLAGIISVYYFFSKSASVVHESHDKAQQPVFNREAAYEFPAARVDADIMPADADEIDVDTLVRFEDLSKLPQHNAMEYVL